MEAQMSATAQLKEAQSYFKLQLEALKEFKHTLVMKDPGKGYFGVGDEINLSIEEFKHLLVNPTRQQEFYDLLNNGKPITHEEDGKIYTLVQLEGGEVEKLPELILEEEQIEIIGCQFCQLRKQCKEKKNHRIINKCDNSYEVLNEGGEEVASCWVNLQEL